MSSIDPRDFTTTSPGQVPRMAQNADQASSTPSRGSTSSAPNDQPQSPVGSEHGSAEFGASPDYDDVPGNFFLGQKFFSYALAELVLQNSESETTADQLKSKLDSVVDAFPFQEAIDKLHTLKSMPELATGGDDLQGTLMINIGALARNADERLKGKMAIAIRSCGLREVPAARPKRPSPRNNQPSWQSAMPSYPRRSFVDDGLGTGPFTPPRQDVELARTNGDREPDMIDWVSKLNLWGQSLPTNVESKYEFRQLDNKDHIAKVNVGGSRRYFEGVAKKKADAKQEAAMKACTFLNL